MPAPFLIAMGSMGGAAAGGGAIDYGLQVAANIYVDGLSTQAFTEVNYKSVAISATLSATGFGIGAISNRAISTYNTISAARRVQSATTALKAGGEATKTGGKELFNFGTTAAKHMTEKGRAVPVQILEQAIKGSKGVADPQGSRALMHSIEIFRNGKAYKLDVLYDKATNSIWHFQYSPIKP